MDGHATTTRHSTAAHPAARRANPGWWPHPTLSALLLVAAALAATLLPDAFVLERDALERGEVWRLWTGHFVHHTWAHFAFDVGVGVVLALVLRNRLAWLVLPPVVGGAVLALEPGLTSYAGLSGVLHGLTVLACLALIRRGRGAERLLAAAVLVGVAAKAVYETASGTSVFTGGFDMGATPVHVAHLAGVLGGGLLALGLRLAALGTRGRKGPRAGRGATLRCGRPA